MTATKQENDPTRMYVAIVKLCKALGVKPDSSVPDHELLERLAEAALTVPATIERAFNRGRESATQGTR